MRPQAACAMVVVESTRVSQVTPESPGIPHAMVLTASFALSPATGLSCHRRLRTCIRKLDTSVGVSGPHDFSVRLSALRPKAHPRPPHPAPRFVTLRNAPLWDRTARVVEMICPTPKAKYFCKRDWTDKIRKTKLICPSRLSKNSLASRARRRQFSLVARAELVAESFAQFGRRPAKKFYCLGEQMSSCPASSGGGERFVADLVQRFRSWNHIGP
jgi:hypothetical protein